MSETIIQHAHYPLLKQSPRLDKNKVLHWYFKDTFQLEWTIALCWNNNPSDPIIYSDKDKFLVSFYVYGKDFMVYTFECTTTKEGQKGWISPEDNKLYLSFDKEVSQRFKPGKYSYFIKFVHDEGDSKNITTISANNVVEVERYVPR